MDVEELVRLAIPVEEVVRHGGSGTDHAHDHVVVEEQRHPAGDRVAVRLDAGRVDQAVVVVRTDQLPSEFSNASPRIGFSLSIPRPEQQGSSQRGFAAPLLVIRGGAGIFRGTMPATLAGTAQQQSGLSTAQTQLFCVGSAVPIPNWLDYANNQNDIPSECIDNASTPVITARPTVTTYDPNYGAPKTKRLLLGVQRSLTQRINFDR